LAESNGLLKGNAHVCMKSDRSRDFFLTTTQVKVLNLNIFLCIGSADLIKGGAKNLNVIHFVLRLLITDDEILMMFCVMKY